MDRNSDIFVRLFVGDARTTAYYAHLLAGQRDLHLAGPVDNFDVGIFDSMNRHFFALLRDARWQAPRMKAIVLTKACTESQCLCWQFQGVFGIVREVDCERLLVRAVRHVAEGLSWVPEDVARHWLRHQVRRPISCLTAREDEIVRLVAAQLANKEIAAVLGVTESGVKRRITRLLAKTGFHSRHQLVAFFSGLEHQQM